MHPIIFSITRLIEQAKCIQSFEDKDLSYSASLCVSSGPSAINRTDYK